MRYIQIAVLILLVMSAAVFGQINTKTVMRSLAPLHPHFAMIDTGETVIVFSRIDGDIDGGPVVRYEAVFDDGRIVPLEANYLNLNANWLSEGSKVAFRAIFDDGSVGNLSVFLEAPKLASYDDPSGDIFGDVKESGTLVAEKGGILTPEAATIPALTPPVIGSFTIFRRGTSSNSTDGPWGYWQHETDFHHAGGGVGGANDLKAFDINLNISRAVSGASNLDKGMDFYAAYTGFVVKYNGVTDPGSCTPKCVLIEHNYGSTKFWTGYLHASETFVRVNDYVTPATRIGKIGKSGTTNEHLHFVAYTGSNTRTNSGASQLVSFDPQFGESRNTITMPGQQTIRRNETRLFTTTAYGIRPSSVIISPLNSSSMYPFTWWISSNTNIATVDGYGNVRGKAVGQATITVYFSGNNGSTTVKVVN